MKALRTAPLPQMRSHAVRGLLTTPKSCSGTSSRTYSGRCTGALDMGHRLLDLLAGEEHAMDAVRQALARGIHGIGSVAVELRAHLARVRREQQDAVADAHRLGDGVRHEQHREARVLPELQQLVL